jgi:hypothetical protein
VLCKSCGSLKKGLHQLKTIKPSPFEWISVAHILKELIVNVSFSHDDLRIGYSDFLKSFLVGPRTWLSQGVVLCDC